MSKEDFMTEKEFMTGSLSRGVFEAIFQIKREAILTVLNTYGVQELELKELLWKRFNIPGMEVHIANTALDFLIECCTENKDLEKTIGEEIEKDILYAATYYTNINPEAIQA